MGITFNTYVSNFRTEKYSKNNKQYWWIYIMLKLHFAYYFTAIQRKIYSASLFIHMLW